jgi:hypothetical protein
MYIWGFFPLLSKEYKAAMSNLVPVRVRWGFLQTLHPLFLLAESLPTIERADQGYYGSTTLNDVDRLKNEITTLRNDLKLNIIKQQLVDIDQLTEDDPTLEGLERDLQTLLEDLEHLIDPQVLRPELDVSSDKDKLKFSRH